MFITLGALTAHQLFANTANISKITRTPFSEGAWSRGSYGLTMSGGIHTLSLAPNSLPEDGSFLDLNDKFTWQTFEFTKGIIWPVDLNLSLSYNEKNNLLKWNGLLQYSIFQRPFFPSIALRGAVSNVNAHSKFEANNYSIAASTSWGYRYLTVFASIDKHLTKATSNIYDLNLTDYSSTEHLGLQYKLTPLSKVSISKTWDQGNNISNELKISVGL
jgi:hypothetical protein